MRISLLVTAWVLCATCAAPAQSAASERRVLVELFTSEGCSSCPPADRLLRELEGKRTESGETIVVLSEHVTYWNQLGWSDPFSAQTFTDRQDTYERRFRLDSSYTPQMVIGGSRQAVGSDGAGVKRALAQAAPAGDAAVRIGDVMLRGDHVEVAFTLAGDVPADADLFAALADDSDSSNVSRGENAGVTLTHTSVARSLAEVQRVAGSRKTTVLLAVPKHGGAAPGHQHVVVWLQAKGMGAVLDVETKAL